MKKTTVILTALILVFLFGLTRPLGFPAYGQLTPTVPLYLPYLVNPPPTPTATQTPTATATVPGPTHTPTPSRTPTRTPTVPSPANVRLTYILYEPSAGTLEEYVRIQNLGGTTQTMTGWTLRDLANHVFTFPTFALPAGGTVQIWTKSGTNTSTNLYWGSGQAIWNNSGDTATLKNASVQTISTCTYPSGPGYYTCP